MSAMGLGRVKTLLHDADRRGRTQATAIRSIWANFAATRPELILTRCRGSFTRPMNRNGAPAPVSRRPHRRQQRFHPDDVQHACQIVAKHAEPAARMHTVEITVNVEP